MGAMGRCDGTRRTDGEDESEAAKMEGSPRLATPLCRRRMSTLVGGYAGVDSGGCVMRWLGCPRTRR